MKQFRKIYLEISNICNLRCEFCPGTTRTPAAMSEADFTFLLSRLNSWTDYLYFHLMGEPLCHPQLERFLALAAEAGFHVILTTNGTLLPQCQQMLLQAPGLHKVNISLHAFEANTLQLSFSDYLQGCFAFGQAAAGEKLVVYRLWNQGGADSCNDAVLQAMEKAFPKPWKQERLGYRISDRTYLEYGDKFDWPDYAAEEGSACIGCYGLRDQLGVLCNGTVVPCCLDHNGDLALGNLFEQSLDEILRAPRASAIYEGFLQHRAVEPLCRRCGFARKFQ